MPGVFNFICEVFLSPTRMGRPLSLIAIDRRLPQVRLKFGLTDLDESLHTSVCGIVDSGASLCTGNLILFAAFCEEFPIKTDDFALICLSGIIKEDEKEATTAELPALYTLHMP